MLVVFPSIPGAIVVHMDDQSCKAQCMHKTVKTLRLPSRRRWMELTKVAEVPPISLAFTDALLEPHCARLSVTAV